MAYIHVKKVGGKKYYTLRVSVRDKAGRVITKDIENLGSDLSKINIENLEKKHKKETRKSYHTIKKFLESEYYLNKAKNKKLKKSLFFSKEQMEFIESTKIHYDLKFLKFSNETKKEIFDIFLIKFAVSSTSIEGNTITLKEATKLLREHRAPKNRTLREIYDLQNSKNVFFDLLGKKPELSLNMIEEVHDALLERIDSRKGYRNHDIRILGQPFKPSPAHYVKTDIKLLLDWFNKQKKTTHPLALVIFFHHKFENIHPFSDGNGRTGRILLNHILLTLGYPPLIIQKKNRDEYIEAMNEADNAIRKNLLSTDIKPYQKLFNFIYAEYKGTYWNTFCTL